MKQYKLGEMETAFAEIIWDNAPVTSGELVKLCEEKLDWKKSTTYTVLKRLCEKGLFANNGGTVEVLIQRQEFYTLQSRRFVAETFDGSLPAFLAAFTGGKRLKPEEVAQLRKMVDSYGEG